MSYPTCPTHDQLTRALKRYEHALILRAKASKSSKDLVKLDEWYRSDDVRASVRKRPKLETQESEGQNARSLSAHQLTEIVKWKLARGKWRPRLLQLAQSNSPESIDGVTSIACTAYSAEDALPALKSLTALSGIGPATASAILALWYPQHEPFMSDEAVLAMGTSKPEYTLKGWSTFREKMRERAKAGNWEMETLEKACYSWAILKQFGEEEAADLTTYENKIDSAPKGKRKKIDDSPQTAKTENSASPPATKRKRKTRAIG